MSSSVPDLEELRRQLERVLQRVVEQNQLENPSS